MVGLLLLLVIALGPIFWSSWYNSTDHQKIPPDAELLPNAEIVKVDRKRSGLKGSYRFRTIVTFSDGFEYISHKTNVENYIISYTISVDRSLTKEILLDAVNAHACAVAKYSATQQQNSEGSSKISLPDSGERSKEHLYYLCPSCGRPFFMGERVCRCGYQFSESLPVYHLCPVCKRFVPKSQHKCDCGYSFLADDTAR